MKKLFLTPVTLEDTGYFHSTEYDNLSIDKRKELVEHSNKEMHDGKFFKFFTLKNERETIIGFMNFSECSKSVISICPLIKSQYRQKGYATIGLNLAHIEAKKRGYNVVLQTVREDNFASIKLHEKMGFELVKSCISKNNKPIRIYLKTI